MSRLIDAMEQIRALECPTGDVVHRVTGILEDYQVANGTDITVERELGKNGLEIYRAQIGNHGNQPIMIIVQSGADDYVAKVIDVHIG